MPRSACALILLVVVGCAMPPERVPVLPLPEDGQPLPYNDVVTRCRLYAASANEAFYVNKWTDLEEAANGLDKAARFLAKATEPPAKFKDKLPDLSAELLKEVSALREGAVAKDVKQTNAALQRLNLKVRELRAEN